MKKTLLLILTSSLTIATLFQNKNFFNTSDSERDAEVMTAYDEYMKRPKKDSIIHFSPEQKKFLVYNSKRNISIKE